MAEIQLTSLPYQQDTTQLFNKIAHLPWAVYLDSCAQHKSAGRFDIITAKPRMLVRTFGKKSIIEGQGQKWISTNDPFMIIKDLLETQPKVNIDLPFVGGALGYFSYDLARRIESIPIQAIHDVSIPEMAIGIYDWALVIDHEQRLTRMVCSGEEAHHLSSKMMKLFEQTAVGNQPFKLLDKIKQEMTEEQYRVAFNKIKQYIHAGDCYQVNLTQRLSAPYSGSTWQAYQLLRCVNPAPFSAYFNCPPYSILSLSPERFIYSKSGFVESKPIKGTRPRNLENPQLDDDYKTALLADPKDRAENLMIVDLIRNDLGKSCQIGSIKVPKLFDIESYPAVHHLVSTITGQLERNKHNLDLLRGCFPGGSVTGTPKLRAMEVIEEIEVFRRSIYCGALGYVSYNGNMDTNVTIRTLLASKNRLYCYSGGAITADSEQDVEYQECFDKLSVILKTLNLLGI